MKKIITLFAILSITSLFIACDPPDDDSTVISYYTNNDKSALYTNVKHLTITGINSSDDYSYVRIASIPSSSLLSVQSIIKYTKDVDKDLSDESDIYYIDLVKGSNPPKYNLKRTCSAEGVLTITVSVFE